MLRKRIFLVVALALVFGLSACVGPSVEEATPRGPATEAPTEPTPATATPGQQVSPSGLNPDDIHWLAKVIASEAGSVYDKGNWVRCTNEERAAVGWTVLNRLKGGTFGRSIKEVVTAPGQYAHNQEPTPEIIELATKLLEGQIADATGGATHFFSPISMPKEGEATTGFDVRRGHLYQVPGIDRNVYFPSWSTQLVWVGDLNEVRSAYFMFYRAVTPAPKPASILYVVDGECPYYTEEWPLHLLARGFEVDTVTVSSPSVDTKVDDYDLVVVGYVLNSRVNVPIYTSVANSGLPVLNGDQDLVQLFGQGTDTFGGVTIYGDSIHVAADHPLTEDYKGDVICTQYTMYRNIISGAGTILATATGSWGPASGTGDIWTLNGNRIYFGFWPSGQDNAHYWTFFDRSIDYLIGLPTLKPEPEQKFIGLSLDEMYEKLFHSNLAYPQQEELWKNYKGKQVEWTGTLREKNIREDRLEALFTPYVIVEFKDEERQALSQLEKGGLVTYRGTLDSYGTNMVIILLDYGFSIQAVEEMGEDYQKGLTWSQILEDRGFDLSTILEKSDFEFQEMIILKDGVIISYE